MLNFILHWWTKVRNYNEQAGLVQCLPWSTPTKHFRYLRRLGYLSVTFLLTCLWQIEEKKEGHVLKFLLSKYTKEITPGGNWQPVVMWLSEAPWLGGPSCGTVVLLAVFNYLFWKVLENLQILSIPIKAWSWRPLVAAVLFTPIQLILPYYLTLTIPTFTLPLAAGIVVLSILVQTVCLLDHKNRREAILSYLSNRELRTTNWPSQVSLCMHFVTLFTLFQVSWWAVACFLPYYLTFNSVKFLMAWDDFAANDLLSSTATVAKNIKLAPIDLAWFKIWSLNHEVLKRLKAYNLVKVDEFKGQLYVLVENVLKFHRKVVDPIWLQKCTDEGLLVEGTLQLGYWSTVSLFHLLMLPTDYHTSQMLGGGARKRQGFIYSLDWYSYTAKIIPGMIITASSAKRDNAFNGREIAWILTKLILQSGKNERHNLGDVIRLPFSRSKIRTSAQRALYTTFCIALVLIWVYLLQLDSNKAQWNRLFDMLIFKSPVTWVVICFGMWFLIHQIMLNFNYS